jgi:hypothetical protein
MMGIVRLKIGFHNRRTDCISIPASFFKTVDPVSRAFAL